MKMLYPLVAFFAAILPLHRPAFGIDELRRPQQIDSREIRLAAFFGRYQCPAPYYVSDYLHAADSNALDYRLLPAISVTESTCGQYATVNNRWGWDDPPARFRSVPHGIRYIAGQLSQGARYRDKTLKQKLLTYNPDPQYGTQILRLMREIDAAP